uniref:X8 domain-containing protein n=1 Tax=Salix viminalis TaxID=40686 RepID=A0A6N2NAA3_SALVM
MTPTNQTYCAAKEGADPKMLQAALDWACGPGKVNCSAMLQGEACYEPDNVIAHATYAFNSYYNRMGKAPGTCDFNGVGCYHYYKPDTGKMNSVGNITAPSMNSTSSAPPVRNLYNNLGSMSFLLLRVLICSIVFL